MWLCRVACKNFLLNLTETTACLFQHFKHVVMFVSYLIFIFAIVWLKWWVGGIHFSLGKTKLPHPPTTTIFFCLNQPCVGLWHNGFAPISRDKKGACVNQLCRSFVSSVMSRCFVRMIKRQEYICMVRVVLRFIYIYIRCVYICIYTWMNASPCTLSRERCGQGSFGVLEAGLNKGSRV